MTAATGKQRSSWFPGGINTSSLSMANGYRTRWLATTFGMSLARSIRSLKSAAEKTTGPLTTRPQDPGTRISNQKSPRDQETNGARALDLGDNGSSLPGSPAWGFDEWGSTRATGCRYRNN